jgi:hypothetical protein
MIWLIYSACPTHQSFGLMAAVIVTGLTQEIAEMK